jgi:polyisoprenoid-binding protein YceI
MGSPGPNLRLRAGATVAAFRIWLLLALVTGPAGVLSGQAASTDWSIDSVRSRLVVNVLPAGLLASALHAHHFQPEVWGGEIALDPDHPGSMRVDVRIAADSLRDHQPKLSAKDVAKVERQVRGAEILDAEKFPRILFEARELQGARLPPGGEGDFRATLVATRTLRGQTRPLRFPIQGRVTSDRLEAVATLGFKQSEFGIKPYTTALGTVSVRDEITVEISVVALPRTRSASARF